MLCIVREVSGAEQLTSSGTLSIALAASMPIALAGLGGLWSERAGIVNIGLEGQMILGTLGAGYYGYHYKILTGQGKNAPGGAFDYVVRGRMIGGFAVVAWPVKYGDTGVMTFIVNHDGGLYEKDLGPDTASRASAMTRFDPDSTWQKVEP